jgi:hypothetical protein
MTELRRKIPIIQRIILNFSSNIESLSEPNLRPLTTPDVEASSDRATGHRFVIRDGQLDSIENPLGGIEQCLANRTNLSESPKRDASNTKLIIVYENSQKKYFGNVQEIPGTFVEKMNVLYRRRTND